MSSPDKGETVAEVAAAAGHPPAVKAGGMRIVQDKTHLKKKNEVPIPKPEEDALKVANSPPKQLDLMSGATSKGHADFPAAAVDSFHTKPIVSLPNNRGASKPVVIQQPKK